MTVGCHPTRCSEFDSHADGPEGYFNALRSMLEIPEAKGKIVAIGECGLGKGESNGYSPHPFQVVVLTLSWCCRLRPLAFLSKGNPTQVFRTTV